MLSYSTCCQLNKTTAAIAAVVEIISEHRRQKIAFVVAALGRDPVAQLLERELIPTALKIDLCPLACGD